MIKRLILKSLIFTAVGLLLAGCSPKQQINPDPSGYSLTEEEEIFNSRIKMNKDLQAKFKEGEAAGYAKALEEIKPIIPYLEAIRASSLINEYGGLCYAPTFIDKSEATSVKFITGQAHICPEFTLDNIFVITKNGIPGLPEYVVKRSEYNGFTPSPQNGFVPPSISFDGMDKVDHFIKKPSVSTVVKVSIADNFVNRQILRESSYDFSDVKSLNKRLDIEFKSEKDKALFCQTYKVCGK